MPQPIMGCNREGDDFNPPAHLPLGDALERVLGVVGRNAPLGGGLLREEGWKTRRGTLTTPRCAPISTPNCTARRLAVQRAVSSGR